MLQIYLRGFWTEQTLLLCLISVKKHKDENWANTLKSFSREPNSAKVVTSWEAKSCLLPGQSQVQHNSLTHCSISFCYLAKDGHPVFVGLRARDNLRRALCVFICVCVQNMCLRLSVCDLQQQTLVAVMSIQVVVVLKSSQSHTHSRTLSPCVWPDTCSPDVGRHSWRSHHTCGQFMSPHTILTLSQSTCRFVEPESSYEETTAQLRERNTLTCNSLFSHLKAWKLWLKIGGCVSNKPAKNIFSFNSQWRGAPNLDVMETFWFRSWLNQNVAL